MEPSPAVRSPQAGRPKQSRQVLLDAAAAVFVSSGVDAPVRAIAAEAGVGVGTIYRHFPTRSDLVVAVYQHQVETCAEAGPRLLAERETPEEALRAWVKLFVEFLVTKRGLANALQGRGTESHALHAYFVDRLVPVCESLLRAASEGSGVAVPVNAYNLLKGIGNLCIGATNDAQYDPAVLVQLLISGALRSRTA